MHTYRQTGKVEMKPSPTRFDICTMIALYSPYKYNTKPHIIITDFVDGRFQKLLYREKIITYIVPKFC